MNHQLQLSARTYGPFHNNVELSDLVPAVAHGNEGLKIEKELFIVYKKFGSEQTSTMLKCYCIVDS